MSGGTDHDATTRSIDALAAEARRARETTDPPADPPDEERALAALRDGLGPVVSRYVAARTGEYERLSAAQHDALHRATNDWLAVYARHYGAAVDPDVTVRAVAEALLDTRDLATAARLLTRVPGDEVRPPRE